MKILRTKLCAIFAVALYTSPVCATAFQLDFSINWRVPQSILQFGIGEAETLIFSSLNDTEDVKQHSAALAASAADFVSSDKHNLFLISTNNMELSDVSYTGKHWIKDDYSTIGYVSGNTSLSGTPIIRADLRPDVSSAVIRVIDEQGFDFNTSLQSMDTEVVMAMAGSIEHAEKPVSLFSFLPRQHLRSQNIPDPAPLWLVGLMLGITGVAWRLLNLSR